MPWMIWPAYEAWVRWCDSIRAVGRAKTDDERRKLWG